MMCGGCVGRVKRLLEGHTRVTTASVNLATETALVRIAMDAAASMDASALQSHSSELMAIGTALAQVRSYIARRKICTFQPGNLKAPGD